MTTIHLNPDDIMQVYVSRRGKSDACCCGCSGTHRYNSKHLALANKSHGGHLDKSDVNDRHVANVLNIVKTAAAGGADVMLGRNFLSVKVDDKLYVVYPACWKF